MKKATKTWPVVPHRQNRAPLVLLSYHSYGTSDGANLVGYGFKKTNCTLILTWQRFIDGAIHGQFNNLTVTTSNWYIKVQY